MLAIIQHLATLHHSPPYKVKLDSGTVVKGRTIVVATGSRYRKLDIESADRFDGKGVYYGATQLEAAMCGDEEVAIVGGGNAAGEAAVFLADFAKHVHLLVRGPNLSDTMSKYLVARIEASEKISLRTETTVQSLEGDGQLRKIHWRDSSTGLVSSHLIQHLFMMAGANPNTAWLGGCVALDSHNFIKTGADVLDAWTLKRSPFPLETSVPGVFAIGDARAGSIKRVASAVGEGSMAIDFIHQLLAMR
jgi:thioredoxin reductase (NADPH)